MLQRIAANPRDIPLSFAPFTNAYVTFPLFVSDAAQTGTLWWCHAVLGLCSALEAKKALRAEKKEQKRRRYSCAHYSATVISVPFCIVRRLAQQRRRQHLHRSFLHEMITIALLIQSLSSIRKQRDDPKACLGLARWASLTAAVTPTM